MPTFGNIKPLRTAVLISGHLRTFEKTYNSFIQNILNPIEADVFIHTWETLGSTQSKSNSDADFSRTPTESKLNEINRIINPVSMNIETYGEYDRRAETLDKLANLTSQDRGGLHMGNIKAYASMLYSMNQVRRMVEKYERNNGFEYNMMIRLRTDCEFTKRMSITAYDENNLYVPRIGKYLPDGMNDQFAVGNGRNIKHYHGLYEQILFYINHRSCTIRPESMIRHHVKSNGTPIIEDNIEFNILRPDNHIIKQTTMGQHWVKNS